MRIICFNVGDFIANLEAAAVHWNIVHVDRSDHVISDVVTERIYQASAVIDRADGQLLVQLGQNCGRDIDTEDGDSNASVMREIVHGELKSYCERRGLTIKPGILEM